MSATVDTGTAIRPFHVEIAEEASDDLRRRVAATRWPSKELVADRSQGVQLTTAQALARYWQDGYDFGRIEERLNALPQFVTEIDGVDIHFIHVRSQHEDALPLIMTHGWPGSVIELIDAVGPLTDPAAHGGSAEDAFHLVLPSLPGYGFSAEPVEIGWDLGRTARAWAELMSRLGYTRYVAQGGDVGAGVTDAMSRQEPEGLAGIHTNLLVPALNGPMPANTESERAAAAQIGTFRKSGNGYFVEMATRPQTIGYALLDSPVALAAWMVDHDTDAYYKIASAFVEDKPSGNLTRDHILDNVTLYWLTGTGASTDRSYWEAYGPDAPAATQKPLPASSIPFGFTTFPGEIWKTPRSWVEASYPNVIYFNEVDKGGHFAAWEEPELFATEIRAAFRPLREGEDFMSTTVDTGTGVVPFAVEISQEEIDNLRRRIEETRWPPAELVTDASQGVRLELLRELARYWVEEYDFGRLEARLNALPQYTTSIDGLDIHFIHVKSEHDGALPLIITHGWPGSVIEMLDVIGPLTDPTAHGGSIDDAFDVVIPSIPGYGFSSQPTEVGWDSGRIAAAWAELMNRLGYSRYVAQGGDQGAGVTDAMGRQAPAGLVGVHFNFLDAIPKELLTAALTPRIFTHPEREQLGKVVGVAMRGYISEMNEHPQTIGYSLLDSPIGLAGWMLDHDADSYEKISKAFLEGEQTGNLSRDTILDNITLYWVTGTGASTSRIYWETSKAATASFKNPPPHMRLPAAYTVFPDELFQAPRHWVKHAYHHLVYYNEAPKGGHFAAWEEPELFAEELRAGFRSLRNGASAS